MDSDATVQKDSNFYKRVLNRSSQRFLEDLDPTSTLDLFLQEEYLPYPQVRDIQEQPLTSNKTRDIIKRVGSKGVEGYETFKKLLLQSDQKHLVEYLDSQETKLKREIIMEENNQDKKSQARATQNMTPIQAKKVKVKHSGVADGHRSTGNSHTYNPSDQEKSSRTNLTVTDDLSRLTISDEDSRTQESETPMQNIGERNLGPVRESEYRNLQPNDARPNKMRLGNTHTDGGNNTGLQENSSQGKSCHIDETDAAPITISVGPVRQETQRGLAPGKNYQNKISDKEKYLDHAQSAIERLRYTLREEEDTHIGGHVSGQLQVFKEDVQNPNMQNIEETQKRLKRLFKNEQNMKGRLRTLEVENIHDIMFCCDDRIAGSGGFGEIYISMRNIAGLDMRVVLKKIECSNDEDVHKMRSITNEKLASRTMHYGIVPLLAMGCDSNKRTYYFLTPYLENGDLFHGIVKDNIKLKKREEVTLDADTRLRILFQITSAVDFLHTPVKKFRGAVIHMDIKALNIVLDKCNNARLIDFGLAREMREGRDNEITTMKQLPHTPGHFKTIRHDMLTKHADNYNIGVVIRQLLTGKDPYIKGEKELREYTDNKVKSELLGIWENDEKQPFEVAEKLVCLSTKCLKHEQLTSTEILKEMETFIQKRNVRRWQRPIENASATNYVSKCEICMEHPAVHDKVIQHASYCRDTINVCVSCMLHSYCNPIRCHSCDKRLTPTIGHGWAALLIAGNDTNKEKVAKGFTKDITDVHEVITSKFPLVMGVRKEHVAMVRPEKPGNAEKFKGENGQLNKAFKILEEINNIQTLLIYFSGHHFDGKGFQLGSAEEFLSLEELQTKVSSCLSGGENDSPTFSLCNKRLIVFLDCCSAPGMKLPRFEEKSGLSLVQLNACRPNQATNGDAENGSKFTLFFKQGLTGKALGKQCFNILERKVTRCQECELPGDFVTLQSLNGYITRHLQPYETNYQAVIYHDNASDLDTKIGYAIQYSVELQFTFKFDDDEKRNNSIPQRMFTDMISLRTILSDKFIEVMKPGGREEPPLGTEVFRDILCIEIEHGPKYVHRDELDSLERVMGAWFARQDLIVSLRRLSDIRNGKVGMFLPTDSPMAPFKEYLDQNKYFKELGPNSEDDAVYSIKLENLTKISIERDKPHLEKFRSILTDLEDELSEEKVYKEMHFIFPGALGKRRNDFICFQIVKPGEEN